jgi:hypothetical protein
MWCVARLRIAAMFHAPPLLFAGHGASTAAMNCRFMAVGSPISSGSENEDRWIESAFRGFLKDIDWWPKLALDVPIMTRQKANFSKSTIGEGASHSPIRANRSDSESSVAFVHHFSI